MGDGVAHRLRRLRGAATGEWQQRRAKPVDDSWWHVVVVVSLLLPAVKHAGVTEPVTRVEGRGEAAPAANR